MSHPAFQAATDSAAVSIRVLPWALRHVNDTIMSDLVMGTQPLISVIDDSESVRESLPDLLKHVGFAVLVFSSAEEFLSSAAAHETSCLILDVGLPAMSGPDLLRELRRLGRPTPIVFITGQDDSSLGPHLVALGAVACLFKPFSDEVLLEAVDTALGRS